MKCHPLYLLFSLWIFIWACQSSCQTSKKPITIGEPQDTLTVSPYPDIQPDSFSIKARRLVHAEEYLAAYNAYNSAAFYYGDLGNWNLYLRKKDSAINCLRIHRMVPSLRLGIKQTLNAMEEVKDKNLEDSLALSNLWYTYATLHYVMNNYDQMEKALSQAMSLRLRHGNRKDSTDGIMRANIHNTKGLMLIEKENFSEAQKELETALKLRQEWVKETHPNPLNHTSLMYGNIGTLYLRQGQLEKALSYHEKAMSMKEKTQKKGGLTPSASKILRILITRDINNKAACFEGMGKLDTAIKLYQEVIDRFQAENTPVNSIELAQCRRNLGQAYGQIAEREKAIEQFKLALKVEEEDPKNNPETVIQVYSLLSGVYFEMRKPKPAFVYSQKALNLHLAKHGKRHPDLPMRLFNMGIAYAFNGKGDSSFLFLQKGLKAVSWDFESDDINRNPRVNSIFDLETAQKLLFVKNQLFFFKNDPAQSKLGLQICGLIDSLVARRKMELATRSAQYYLFNRLNNGNITYFEQAALHAKNLYGDYSQEEVVDICLLFMESNKANVLLDQLLATSQTKSGTAQENLIQQKNDLTVQLIEANRKAYQTKAIQEALRLENELLEVSGKIQTQFPVYAQMKENAHSPTVKEIRSNVLRDNHKALISYFWGQRHLYTLIVTPHHQEVIQQKYLSHFIDTLRNFITGITEQTQESLTPQQLKECSQKYSENAYRLYKFLLKPVLPHLTTDIDQLIIVPDRYLHYLPFEALLTEAVQMEGTSKEFRALPYLLNQYSISYGASVGHLQTVNQLEPSTSPYHFGGFAPQYDEEDLEKLNTLMEQQTDTSKTHLSKLEYNVSSVQELATFWKKSKIFTHNSTEEEFKKQADQFQVLHLALHGILHENPNYSGLAFLPTNNQNDGILRISELLSLNLKADLVVLGACDGGVGPYQKGEGLRSISRAFSYSGCPSVIGSLWQLKDKGNGIFMRHLYEGLAAGKNKAVALAEAKRKFIQQEEVKYAKPFYWSGYLLSGKDAPLSH